MHIKQIHIKQIIVLLLVPICLASCDDKEAQMQKTMIEVERLDLLRKKINETVTDRKNSLLSKRREYQAWKSDLLSLYNKNQSQIEKTEKALRKHEQDKKIYYDFLRPDEIREIQAKTQPAIQGLQKGLANAKKYRDEMQRQMNEKEPVYLKEIEALELSLSQAQANYDSLNALHTKEVSKLATYTNK